MDQENLRRELQALLNGLCGEDVFLNPSDDLLETGLLDSLARVEWLERLEDRFGFAPQPTQIPPSLAPRRRLTCFVRIYYAGLPQPSSLRARPAILRFRLRRQLRQKAQNQHRADQVEHTLHQHKQLDSSQGARAAKTVWPSSTDKQRFAGDLPENATRWPSEGKGTVIRLIFGVLMLRKICPRQVEPDAQRMLKNAHERVKPEAVALAMMPRQKRWEHHKGGDQRF